MGAFEHFQKISERSEKNANARSTWSATVLSRVPPRHPVYVSRQNQKPDCKLALCRKICSRPMGCKLKKKALSARQASILCDDFSLHRASVHTLHSWSPKTSHRGPQITPRMPSSWRKCNRVTRCTRSSPRKEVSSARRSRE